MLKKNSFRNTGFYIFLFGVSVVYFITAITLGQPVADTRLTPSFFPLLLGAISVIVSLLLLWGAIKTNKAQDSNDLISEIIDKESRYHAPLTIIATAVFVLLFQVVGFFISSVPYVFVIILLFSNTERLVQKFIYSIIVSLIGYLIFAQIFNVRLPTLLD